jgi:hypothetical protein
MIRQIIVPKKKTYTLKIPESYIGKKIELIAFEIGETESLVSDSERDASVQNLFEKFEGLTFDGKGEFVFSRLDATDYE